jgi:Outer membrane protein beta-barrel domain
MKQFILLLIIAGIKVNLFSQTSGYILKDSAYLSGYIDVQSGKKAFTSCKFSLTKTSGVVNYTPDKVSGFGYGKNNYYSMIVKTDSTINRMFLLAIDQGDFPVYYLNAKSGKHFYILDEKKELVELIREKGKFKKQLAVYFEVPTAEIQTIHTSFSKTGITKTIKILKDVRLAQVVIAPSSKKKLTEKPVAIVSIQSGVTFQQLPIDLHAGLPVSWDDLKASSVTYCLAVDIPVSKNWPLTFHQEICYNKFVTNYKQGAQPPDDQLVQNSSVISIPEMLRYTIGRNKKFTGFINAGIQLDFILNKNNIGWLKLEAGENNTGVTFTSNYLDYQNIQPGITGGFGIIYKLNKNLSLNSEFRYSRVINVLPRYAEAENQYVLKVGIAYNFYKKGINQ